MKNMEQAIAFQRLAQAGAVLQGQPGAKNVATGALGVAIGCLQAGGPGSGRHASGLARLGGILKQHGFNRTSKKGNVAQFAHPDGHKAKVVGLPPSKAQHDAIPKAAADVTHADGRMRFHNPGHNDALLSKHLDDLGIKKVK